MCATSARAATASGAQVRPTTSPSRTSSASVSAIALRARGIARPVEGTQALLEVRYVRRMRSSVDEVADPCEDVAEHPSPIEPPRRAAPEPRALPLRAYCRASRRAALDRLLAVERRARRVLQRPRLCRSPGSGGVRCEAGSDTASSRDGPSSHIWCARRAMRSSDPAPADRARAPASHGRSANACSPPVGERTSGDAQHLESNARDAHGVARCDARRGVFVVPRELRLQGRRSVHRELARELGAEITGSAGGAGQSPSVSARR